MMSERQREIQKRYRERHREELNERMRKRRAPPEVRAKIAEEQRLRRADPAQKRKHAAYMREWYRAHPEAYRAHSLKRHYGITIAEYEALSARQQGRCALCDATFDRIRNGKQYRLSVDHCHETGRIRGLLCHTCNKGLGLFKDNPSLLRSAALYLESAE